MQRKIIQSIAWVLAGFTVGCVFKQWTIGEYISIALNISYAINVFMFFYPDIQNLDQTSKQRYWKLIRNWIKHPYHTKNQLAIVVQMQCNDQITEFNHELANQQELEARFRYNIAKENLTDFRQCLNNKPNLDIDFVKSQLKKMHRYKLRQFVKNVNTIFYPKFKINQRSTEELLYSSVDCDTIIKNWYHKFQ